MNRSIRIISVLTVVFILMSALCINTSAAVSTPTVKNMGTRNTVCTALSASATSYYTENYTYDTLSQKSSAELLTSLRTFMTTTHTGKSSYKNCKEYAYYTDCQNGGTDNTVSLIYSSYSATSDQWASDGSNGWNREHVWPRNLGGKYETSDTPGCDLHHVRPSDARINSVRNDRKYGNVTGGTATTGVITTASGGEYKGDYFEPLDNVKGDVARICLYVYVRYGAEYSALNNITNVFESVDVLLEWCELDPVDTWEMSRTDVVESVQGNRNVFIDYPEYAWLLFGEEMPTDMQTPSGMAKQHKPSADDTDTPAPETNTSETNTTETNAPATEAPATEAPKAESPATDGEKQPTEAGCGSSIAISSICFVGIVALAAVIKKKEDQ